MARSTFAARKASAATRARATAAPALVHGVRVTHPDRVIDPSTGITKRELAGYYDRAAGAMLPHLSTRPIALVRAPDGLEGEMFFNKHAARARMPRLTQLPAGLDPGHPPLLAIESAEALVEAAQYSTIEVHTWNAHAERIDTPDRFVLDLDPGAGIDFATLREGARLVQSLLDELGLAAFLKTSGGKGLHVVVPIAPKLGWDAVKDFTGAVVDHLAATLPDRFVARSGEEHRVGRVFVDYLRNGRGSTTACAFSARARPGMGVSIPIGWDELDAIGSGAHWTIRTAHQRFARDDDPWGDYAGTRQSIAAAIKRLARSAGAAASSARASRTR